MLKISEQMIEGVRVVSLAGKLDLTTSQTLLDQLGTAVDGGERRLVLDCTPLEYISSSGLRAVLVLAQRMEELGGKLAVAALSERVRKIFDMAGFSSIVASYDSSERALKALQRL